MKRLAAALLIGSSLLVVSNPSFAADRVKAGDWQTKLVSSPGSAPMVSSYCITAADAKAMNGDVATLRKYLVDSTALQTKGRCTVKSVGLKGNETTVTIACGKTEVTSTTIYFGDHYESSSSTGTRLTGKRTGDCKK